MLVPAMQTIKNMIEDTVSGCAVRCQISVATSSALSWWFKRCCATQGNDETIPLPNVSGRILAKVWCRQGFLQTAFSLDGVSHPVCLCQTPACAAGD